MVVFPRSLISQAYDENAGFRLSRGHRNEAGGREIRIGLPEYSIFVRPSGKNRQRAFEAQNERTRESY